MNDLTEIINRRIERLQHVVSSAPTAGELCSIRDYLTTVMLSVNNFVDLLDDIEHWRGPDALAGDDHPGHV